MKIKNLAFFTCLALFCFFLKPGVPASAEDSTPYSKEIMALPANVDGWGGTTGSREISGTTVICYFDYSETNANFIKFNLWQLVQENAPSGVYKVTLCYSTGDESGEFVMNIRGKEHLLSFGNTAPDYSTFAPGYMTTYEYFDFSAYNTNDILLYNGSADANPDLKSIRLDYVSDYPAFSLIEAESADSQDSGVSVRNEQSASDAKIVTGLSNSAETPAAITFTDALQGLGSGAHKLLATYMTADADRTLVATVNGTDYVLNCPPTTGDWNEFKVGYAETLISLKGDGTDTIVFREGGNAGATWLDCILLAPVDLVKDITAIPAVSNLSVDFGTAFSKLPLPSSVPVTLKNGSTANLAVNWAPEGYVARTAKTYTLTGRLVLENGITNSTLKTVTINVTVKENTDPDYEKSVLTLEAEEADEWGGWAGVRDMPGASGGKVLSALSYNQEHSNHALYNDSLKSLKKGTYKVRVTYTSGDAKCLFVLKVNGMEHLVEYGPSGENAWSVFTPGVVYSDSFEIKGDGMDEIMLYDGAEYSSLWYDTIEFIAVSDTPAPQPQNPVPGDTDPEDNVPTGRPFLGMPILAGAASLAAVLLLRKRRLASTH